METAEIIDPGFSVADAEDVNISTDSEGLLVEFKDWREKRIKVVFPDAVAHQWDLIDWAFLEGERFDCAHIIHNSKWLEKYLSQGTIEKKEKYKHFRLNFNAEGTLQVLATNIIMMSEQGSGGGISSSSATRNPSL